MPELISVCTQRKIYPVPHERSDIGKLFFLQTLISVSFHQGKEKEERTEHSHRNISTSRTCLSARRFEGRALEKNAIRKFEAGGKNEIVLLMFGDIVC